MEQIISLIAIWAPSIVSILGVITTVLLALGKTKDALTALAKDETMNELKKELKVAIQNETEIKEQYDILINEITKVKDYRENK